MSKNLWGAIVAGIFLIGLVGLAVYGSVRAWSGLEGVEISIHGYIALTFGVVGTLGLGIGLMLLSFHSSRSGKDDEIDFE